MTLELCAEVTVQPPAEHLEDEAKAVLCEKCGKKFAYPGCLYAHQRIHFHNKKTPLRFLCPVQDCKHFRPTSKFGTTGFTAFALLKQHYQKTHNEKRFVCAFCEQFRFSLSRDLRFHQKKCPERIWREEFHTAPASIPKPKLTRGRGRQKVVVLRNFRIVFNAPAAERPKLRKIASKPRVPSPPRSFRRIAPKVAAVTPPQCVGKDIETQTEAFHVPPKDAWAQTVEEFFRNEKIAREFFHPPSETQMLPPAYADYPETYEEQPASEEYFPQLADFFCQTTTNQQDASVSADLSRMMMDDAEADFRDAILLSTIETQTEERRPHTVSTGTDHLLAASDDFASFEDILHNIETQTPAQFFNHIETQTVYLPAAHITTETQTG